MLQTNNKGMLADYITVDFNECVYTYTSSAVFIRFKKINEGPPATHTGDVVCSLHFISISLQLSTQGIKITFTKLDIIFKKSKTVKKQLCVALSRECFSVLSLFSV